MMALNRKNRKPGRATISCTQNSQFFEQDQAEKLTHQKLRHYVQAEIFYAVLY